MMDKRISCLLLFCLILSQMLGAQTRTIIVLDDGWKFSRGNHEQAFKIDFDDSNWEDVNVPHDWAIKGPFDKEVDKQMVAISQNQEN